MARRIKGTKGWLFLGGPRALEQSFFLNSYFFFPIKVHMLLRRKIIVFDQDMMATQVKVASSLIQNTTLKTSSIFPEKKKVKFCLFVFSYHISSFSLDYEVLTVLKEKMQY